MKFTTEAGEELRIEFSHFTDNRYRKGETVAQLREAYKYSKYEADTILTFLKVRTEARIRREDGAIIALGSAQRSLKDQFNKETGRKIALTRALASLPKEDRRLAWEAYFGRKPRAKPSLTEAEEKATHPLFYALETDAMAFGLVGRMVSP